MTERLPWRTATIRSVIFETARAKSFVLDVPGWPGHLAGQHVDVRLTADDGYQAERSYSIASAPEDPFLSLTVERVDDGEVSPWFMDEARAGDSFELRGPLGGYFVWSVDTGGPLQLVAGGSGIVPLMAMLRHRARRGTDIPARLLYSARTRDLLVYRDELAELDAQVRFTLTRESPAGWRTGRLDAAVLDELTYANADEPRIFVCGPAPFVATMANHFVALGHAAERIKTESFGPTGVNDCHS